jgi:hypothetical protein
MAQNTRQGYSSSHRQMAVEQVPLGHPWAHCATQAGMTAPAYHARGHEFSMIDNHIFNRIAFGFHHSFSSAGAAARLLAICGKVTLPLHSSFNQPSPSGVSTTPVSSYPSLR